MDSVLEQPQLGSCEIFKVVCERTSCQFARVVGGIALDTPQTNGEDCQVGNALSEKDEKIARLEVVAYCDGLTGLPNRAGVIRELQQHTTGEEPAITGNNFAVVALDVDNFKAINDAYDHLAGDAVLQAIAEVLSTRVGRQVRGTACIVGRWGGDEFVVIIPTPPEAGNGNRSPTQPSPADQAETVMQRITDGFAEEVAKIASRSRPELSFEDLEALQFGVSYGMALPTDLTHSAETGEADVIASYEKLFELADKALCDAKKRRQKSLLSELEKAAFGGG